MNLHNYRFLLSERTTLENLVAQSSPGNVIGRLSLESRLRRVEEELVEYEGYDYTVTSARLAFRGKPIVDNRGIRANFGPDAVKAFAEAVTTVGAGRRGSLASSGPIPHQEDYQLLITGTTSGSFVFFLEDASQQTPLLGHSTDVGYAIEKVKDILEASIGTDEDLTEAIADIDKRSLSAIRAFLQAMADGGATCALEYKGAEFGFTDTAQVRRSEARLDDENIREDQVILIGEFQGFLPNSRRAEFRIAHTDASFLSEVIGTVVTGRVDPTVVANVSINDILLSQVSIGVRTRRVGQGRPRYTITSCAVVA